MVIEFLSLYLGLVVGVQPVVVSVSEAVATVAIVLDDEVVATIEGEPWRTPVDFGDRLLPRRLLAIARDAAGREIGSAKQLINLPRRSAEAGVVLERAGGRVVAARLTWQSVAEARPLKVEATLNGEPLPVADPERIPIPAHDRDRVHLLVAELVFSPQDRVQVVASFGGAHSIDTSTELTAVPVRLSGKRPSHRQALDGAVRRGDIPVPVLSIEKGPSDIVFVRDHEADIIIERLGARQARGVGGLGVSSATGVSEGGVGISGVWASPLEVLRRLLTLDSKDRVRMIWPATKRVARNDVRMDLFPASPVFDVADGGIFWALTQDVELAGVDELQRLTDAVAVAGVTAVADNRRRAVVLVLGAEPADHSRFAPAMVRAFLDALDVPLYVWTVSSDEPSSAPDPWADADGTAEIYSLQSLKRAVRQLERDLERQRILWVEGRYLPSELAIADGRGVLPLIE